MFFKGRKGLVLRWNKVFFAPTARKRKRINCRQEIYICMSKSWNIRMHFLRTHLTFLSFRFLSGLLSFSLVKQKEKETWEPIILWQICSCFQNSYYYRGWCSVWQLLLAFFSRERTRKGWDEVWVWSTLGEEGWKKNYFCFFYT